MKRLDFNLDWTFIDIENGNTFKVNLPHDATINTSRDPGIPLGWLCGYYYGGKYRYVKSFYVPHEYKDKALYLEFEGIYRNSSIYINNKLVKYKVYGYTQFDIRIDEYINFGADNEVKVEIDTPKTHHARWYAGSGIYRNVNLYIGSKTHISIYGIKVTTLSYNPAAVLVETDVVDPIGTRPEIEVEIFDGETKVAQGNGSNIRFDIKEAKLWSAESPSLYMAKVKLISNREVIDESETNFGIRKIEWGPDKGLLINGVETKLRGGCIHNDNGVIGMVTTRATEERRVKNIKAVGFNAIRSAHHPASRSLLEACDKYGLYILDEAFDTWYRGKMPNGFSSTFPDTFIEDTLAMVLNDYNHPSVIMYSIGNEIMEIGSLKGKRYGRKIIEIIRSMDKTRPITLCPSMRLARGFLDGTPYDVIDEDEYLKDPENRKKDLEHIMKVWIKGPDDFSGAPYTREKEDMDEKVTKDLYDLLDIAGYNYYGEYYERLHEIHPERVILGTETNGNKIVFNWDLVKKHKYVIGDFIWTLQDHLGECNCCDMQYGDEIKGKDYPWLTNYCGVIDLIGHALPIVHKYHFVWGMDKGIYLAAQPPKFNGIEPTFNEDKDTDSIESWSFEGYEGKPTYIDVYSDAYEVEVIKNGSSLGKRKIKNFTTRYKTTYEPGELIAIGYDDKGNELYRNSLVSANKDETIITAKADKLKLNSDGNDFSFIEIDITDDKGIIKSLPERTIHVKVEGAGTLQGFGSANYATTEKFDQTHHETFYGRCLVVIRSAAAPGQVKVTISSDGLEKKIILIDVV